MSLRKLKFWPVLAGGLLIALTLAVTATFGQATVSDVPAAPAARGLSLGILVDNSGSYRTIFDRVLTSTGALIDDLSPNDEAFLVTFVDTPKIVLRQEMTTDKAELRDAAENMFIQGGPTAILDAVVFATKHMSESSATGEARQRALVVITDGDERESAATVEEAVKRAKDAGIRIFVLGIHEDKFYTKVVDRLVKDTGGAKFVPRIPKETGPMVKSLVAALRAR